jgi:hypothetical protein
MKKSFFQGMRITAILLILMALFIQGAGKTQSQETKQYQIEKGKIFQEAYPLISESDLYCSFYIMGKEKPVMQIVGAERGDEKILVSDADLVYINCGKNDGLEIGQMFLIIELGPSISSPVAGKNYGTLALKRGRARIVMFEDTRGGVKIEKTCGQIMVGDYLVPFEEKEGLLGKDLGYEAPLEEGTGTSGNIIYLQNELNQIGSGHWALIDLGSENGIKVGQQMTIFRRVQKDAPRQAIANLVVINTQPNTSTVKILSCKEVVRLGAEVQTK